jgi:hypothetical protein
MKGHLFHYASKEMNRALVARPGLFNITHKAWER